MERYEHRHLEIVCELSEPASVSRTAEWAQLKDQALGTDLIPGGVRLWLPARSGDLVRDLARREAQCCGFLDIEVVVQNDRVRLDITSAAPAAGRLVDFLSSLSTIFLATGNEVGQMPKSVLTCDQDYRSEMIDALATFDERVHALQTARGWNAPSPCEGWSAADLIVHVTGNVRTFVAVTGGQVPGQVGDGGQEVPDVIKDWEQVRAAASEWLRMCDDPTAVRVPLGEREMTIAFAVEALLRDVVIHTWDLGRATGGDEILPAHLVTAATASLARLPQRIRERGYYADALEPAPDATDQDRLLALAGRRRSG